MNEANTSSAPELLHTIEYSKGLDVESRIKRNILILGVVSLLLLIAMTAAWYFLLIKPQTEQMAAAETRLEARRAVANRMAKALEDQKKSEDRLIYLNSQLAYFRQRYRSLPFGEMGTDVASETPLQKANRIAAWRRWLNEYYSEYYDALRGSLLSVASETDVVINVPPLKINAPPRAPEDVVVPSNGFFRPASSTNNGVLNATISGSLENIMRFFTRVNYSPILMVIGNVKLDVAGASNNNQGGQSTPPSGTPGQPSALLAAVTTDPRQPPTLTATFTITPYLLTSGEGAKLQTGVANLAQPIAGDPDAPLTASDPDAPSAASNPDAPPTTSPN